MSNFLMGRTFLDIDLARAADLLGMERRQADAIRDLPRGTFLALGPAVSRRPIAVRIGAVETEARSGSPKLVPLPSAPAADLEALVFAAHDAEPLLPLAPPTRRRVTADAIVAGLARPAPEPAAPMREPEQVTAIIASVLRAIVAEAASAQGSASLLFQDFQVRCRMAGLPGAPLDLAAFARALSAARGACSTCSILPGRTCWRWQARCPTTCWARSCWSRARRVRRLLGYIETRGLIVCRTDF